MIKLVRSELMKIWTTSVWWLFGIGVFLFTAIALTVWTAFANEQINEARRQTEIPPDLPPDQLERWQATHDITRVLHDHAAEIYTSGQFFGVMFVMLLGAILITNEFYHQTATATFLTTPKRTLVIISKLITAALAAAFFWIATTIVNVIVGSIFFISKGYDSQLTEWPVQRAILMNGLAFALWGILGVGLGVLLRNQIAAVITGAVAYIIGTQVVMGVFGLVYTLWIQRDWVMQATVLWPSVASSVMVSPEQTFPQSPQWWVGAIVLVAYGLVFGTIGTLITRKRDIS